MEPAERWGRLVLTLVLAAYGVACLRAPEDYRWIDALDLAIHETGHLVFAFGGERLHLLGGTLLQLLLPFAFVVHFLRQDDPHAASVPLWWVAQNCWNVSVYVSDARAQRLPLVGGGDHDWAILLGGLDLLAWDQTLGRVIFLSGVALYAVAIGWGLRSLRAAEPPATQERLKVPAPLRRRGPR